MRALTKFLRDVWSLTWPYWFSEERWSARALLVLVVALNLGLVYISVLFNEWYNLFYNALQDRAEDAYYHQLLRFLLLAAIHIAMAIYAFYLNRMLQIRWRRWLTHRYLDQWLADRVYYRMQLTDPGTDNPDQRIADDLRYFVFWTMLFTLDFMRQVVTLVSFMAILWGLSRDISSFVVLGVDIAVPGFMMWAALLYAIVGTWLTHQVGRPLAKLNFEQQRREADFRYSLVRFRENADGIALYGGEADENRGLRQRFADLFAVLWAVMQRQKLVIALTNVYGQLAVIFPFVVAAPRYFTDSAAQIGILLQTANAFGRVQDALSWFVDNYRDLAEWKATVDRLAGFQAALARARGVTGGAKVRPSEGGDLTLDDVRVALPSGRTLIEEARETVEPGQSVLVTGASGVGKSTLFRTLAGIWPYGEGAIHFPKDARVLFLPQKPYLPIGTLREVICYPAKPAGTDDAALTEVMDACGLDQFRARLDEAQNWSLQLSPGEQQRIAFARALVIKPDWLFLDEATSSLDHATEDRLYRLLRERLPATTLVSIGHRATLTQYHDRRLEVRPEEDGSGRLVAVP
ncbi:MAG: ABC transporter ATP-binding protein/permease [Alphaproteobacteria bacterium]